jgi:hypothetical protein
MCGSSGKDQNSPLCIWGHEIPEAVRLVRHSLGFTELTKRYLVGHIFVTSALLGGQQKTVKVASALEFKDAQQKRDALRGALGARIVAPFISAGLNYSKEHGSGTSYSEDKYTSISYLGMNATGGDTLVSPE